MPSAFGAGGGASLLLVFGGDQAGSAALPGRRRYDGSTDFYRLLGDIRYERLRLGRRLPFPGRAADLSSYACVVNMMTDPDLNRQSLENLQRLLAGYGGKVVNKPQAVLRSSRDSIASILAGTPGLRVPKVARLAGGKPAVAAKMIERRGMAYPLIVRRAGTHTGNIVGLVDCAEALHQAIAGRGDFLATEFVDYRGADGLFRKYRVYFLGKRMLLRHMIVFDHWNVHGGSRMGLMADRPDLRAEEERLFARPEGPFPPHWQRVFDEVRARIPLDFFGLDFGFDREGQAVLFEANATMNFFPPALDPRFDYWKTLIPVGRSAFQQLVAA